MVDMKRIMKNAYPAVCGFSEKEVIVKDKNVDKVIMGLRKKGYYVVGKSLDKGPKKVWFTRAGSL